MRILVSFVRNHGTSRRIASRARKWRRGVKHSDGASGKLEHTGVE